VGEKFLSGLISLPAIWHPQSTGPICWVILRFSEPNYYSLPSMWCAFASEGGDWGVGPVFFRFSEPNYYHRLPSMWCAFCIRGRGMPRRDPYGKGWVRRIRGFLCFCNSGFCSLL